MSKEREKNWCLFWQEQLGGTDHRRPEIAPLLASYYLTAYAASWVEENKSNELSIALDQVNQEIAIWNLEGQAKKIDQRLREFDEEISVNLPGSVDFREVQAFSVGCVRFLSDTFRKVARGEPTKGLSQDLEGAKTENSLLALPYSRILSGSEDKAKTEELLNGIYETHRGFFLALREI